MQTKLFRLNEAMKPKNLSIIKKPLVIVFLIILLNCLSSCKGKTGITATEPRIIDIGRYNITIYWTTTKPVTGTLTYNTAGKPGKTIKEKTRTTSHRMKIGGLMPETIYNYNIKGKDRTYSFRTAPLKETAFRFMIFSREKLFTGGKWKGLLDTYRTQLPDFLILAGNLSAKQYIPEERSFFEKTGIASETAVFLSPSSTDLNKPDSQNYFLSLIPPDNSGFDYTFKYGNSRFIILGPVSEDESLYKKKRSEWIEYIISKNSSEHNFIIDYTSEGISRTIIKLSREGLLDAVFYSGKYRFGSLPEDTKAVKIDERSVVVDVDGKGVTATVREHTGSKTDILTIRETPESVKRSCIYCRKLFESGKYQESIEWYRDFIRTFGEKHLVDEAQFQIANIYDHYLYDYSAAIKEYKNLLNNYPHSNKKKQAAQRLEYLQVNSDYDFKPLGIFEKAKSETYQNDRDMAISEVKSILNKYPGSGIESQVLFWLGHALSEDDLKNSISYYRVLADKSPDKKSTREALTAIGNTYYSHGKYKKAINAYTTALSNSESPDKNLEMSERIRKSKRNIVRYIVLIMFLAMVFITYVFAVLLKPFPVTKENLNLGLILFLVYLVIGFASWFVFYQNYPEVLKIIPVFALVLSSVPVAGSSLSVKVFSRMKPVCNYILTASTVVLLTVFMYYILIYCYHYLPVFGL